MLRTTKTVRNRAIAWQKVINTASSEKVTTAFTSGGIVFKIRKFAQGFLPANNIEQIK
ncbi:MAG: hypothetical protein KME38_08300 [Spirirestis rafaelensis WJT71-NPBG6]|nr:hypothetical protein [Spirirestis rafaelensis WJT71-NPBG6]